MTAAEIQQNLDITVRETITKAVSLYEERNEWVKTEQESIDDKYRLRSRIFGSMAAMLLVFVVSGIIGWFVNSDFLDFYIIGPSFLVGGVGIILLSITHNIEQDKYQKTEQSSYVRHKDRAINDLMNKLKTDAQVLYGMKIVGFDFFDTFDPKRGGRKNKFDYAGETKESYGYGFTVRHQGKEKYVSFSTDGDFYYSVIGRDAPRTEDGRIIQQRLPFSNNIVGGVSQDVPDHADEQRIAREYIFNYGGSKDALLRSPLSTNTALTDKDQIKRVEDLILDADVVVSWSTHPRSEQ